LWNKGGKKLANKFAKVRVTFFNEDFAFLPAEMNLENVCDFRFMSDHQMMATQVKSAFGYIK
jgi:hypothetical protein